MKAYNFLTDLRQKLSEENEKIVNHRFVKDAEDGRLNPDKMRLFTIQQYYIVNYDLRSLATMFSRSRYKDESDFFYMMIIGDKEALQQLLTFSSELGLSEEDLAKSEILPRAVAYTHYLAWLANYASPGEQAVALTVNLPVWGSCCRRLGTALKDKYGFKSIGFFELFSGPYDSIEEAAAGIIERYLDIYSLGMERCAKLIQSYELMFWDSVYEES